jgi:hypothetical protein
LYRSAVYQAHVRFIDLCLFQPKARRLNQTPPSQFNPNPSGPISKRRATGLLIAAGLVPGAGFWLVGRNARAAAHLLIVGVTFALGLALHGGVHWPSWSPSAEDFNLIKNFTVLIQLGAGLPALVSLVANCREWTLLGGIEHHPYYELGGYYLIVAGAINYFAICNVYDRLIHPQPRLLAQEEGEASIKP